MLYVQHMHTLVCRVVKWNYEQLLYGQTFLPTDIRFARANAPLRLWCFAMIDGNETEKMSKCRAVHIIHTVIPKAVENREGFTIITPRHF